MKIFILILLLTIHPTAYAESVTPHYPGAVHQILLHTDQREKQNELAHRIGLNLDTKYSYAEYSDIKRSLDSSDKCITHKTPIIPLNPTTVAVNYLIFNFLFLSAV